MQIILKLNPSSAEAISSTLTLVLNFSWLHVCCPLQWNISSVKQCSSLDMFRSARAATWVPHHYFIGPFLGTRVVESQVQLCFRKDGRLAVPFGGADKVYKQQRMVMCVYLFIIFAEMRNRWKKYKFNHFKLLFTLLILQNILFRELKWKWCHI